MVDKRGAQYAHEPGEYEQFGLVAIEFGNHGPIEGLAVRVVTVFDTGGRNARFLSTLQSKRIRPVAENDAEVQVKIA